jgi:hypothetical protein
MDDQFILQRLVSTIKEKVPDFEVRYKNESLFMKTLGVLLFLFNREFMTRFTTTIGNKVYFPSREAARARPRAHWKVLAHEYVHILDYQDQKLWFKVSYLLPQLGALLALGAFFIPWFLLALLALAPWPSPWRTKWEMRGYTMSMATNYWRYGKITDDTKEWIGQNFWGWNYYKMAWRKKKIQKRLDDASDSIITGAVFGVSPAFVEVRAILNEEKSQIA